MRSLSLALTAPALLLLPSAASATVVASLGGNTTNFVTLSQAGLNGGATATLSGGTVYTSDQPFADIPKGGVFGGTFLAAGILAGQPATLTFTVPTSYLSFLWGSPDTYNVLTLNTNVRSYTYSATGLGFSRTNGDQTFSQYVQFLGSAGELITSVSFSNTPANDAFEVANFSVTAVPEASTWAMMLIGFAAVGATTRYRKGKSNVVYA